MSIYLPKYNKYKAVLELKRSVDGKEEDLDEEEKAAENDTPDNTETDDTEHDVDEDPSNTYDMDDETEGGDTEEDTTDDQTDDATDDTTGDDTATDDATDDTTGDDGATDYSMDDETEGDDTATDDGTTDDTATDDTETDGMDEPSDDEIKQMEDELYKSVPTEQMKIKQIELKKQYLDIYNSIDSIITRTSKIEKTDENIKVLEFVTNKLIELQDLVKFYMTNTFDTKTFIENNINYQQYLATLNVINKIFSEIKDKKQDK